MALPHAYCFVDPLFSTGMAWSLVAVERNPVRARSDALHAARVNGGVPAGFALPQGATPGPALIALAGLLATLGAGLLRSARRGARP